MKRIVVTLFASAIILAGVSCEEEKIVEENAFRSSLLKTWALTQEGYVTLYNVDVTDQFTELTFTFNNNGTYVKRVNGNQVVGSWVATDQSFTTLVLDDTLTVTIVLLTNTELKLSYTSESMTNGRNKGLGMYEIHLHVQ